MTDKEKAGNIIIIADYIADLCLRRGSYNSGMRRDVNNLIISIIVDGKIPDKVMKGNTQ